MVKLETIWQNMDPIQCATEGNVEFFEAAELDIIQNSRSDDGDSVLALAARMGHTECCRVIYERCPRLLYETNKLETPLHEAARAGKPKVIEFLLNDTIRESQKGFKCCEGLNCKLLTMQGRMQYTALHYTAFKGCLRSTNAIIRFGYDHFQELMMMVDANNRTALHTAAEKGHEFIVQRLFEGAKSQFSDRTKAENVKLYNDVLMAGDCNKCTALHYAVENNFVDIAIFLVNVSFKVDAHDKLLAVKNDKNKSATQIAVEKEKNDLAPGRLGSKLLRVGLRSRHV